MRPIERAIRFTKRIFTERHEQFQIRYWRKKAIFLTYPYPVRAGYGTRGEFVGIYSVETPREFIISDLLYVLLGDTSGSIEELLEEYMLCQKEKLEKSSPISSRVL